jgi:putative restriction endonuclease
VSKPKYQPLADFLAASRDDEHTLTFQQIEQVLGSALPTAAVRPPNQHQWWANDDTHSQARAWLGVGWQRKHLDAVAGVVTFVRVPAEGDD